MDSGIVEPDRESYPGCEETFHFLAFPAHLLAWTGDAEGRCDFVSPSWTEFTGREQSEELGHGWLDRVHPEDRGTLETRLEEARRAVVEAFERKFVAQTLKATGGNVTEAARRAGIERQSFQRLMGKYGIASEAFRGDAGRG